MSNNIYDEILSRLSTSNKVKIQTQVTVEAVRKGLFRAMSKVEKEMMGMVTYTKSHLITKVVKEHEGVSTIEISIDNAAKVPATIILDDDDEGETDDNLPSSEEL